jgi:hypothetical protein
MYKRLLGEPAPGLVTAFLVARALNALSKSAAIMDLSFCSINAAAPATCGQAIDVPLMEL